MSTEQTFAGPLPKIAVIGCGYWGRNHARTLAGLGALAGVVDAQAEACRVAAEEFATRALTLEAVLGDDAIDGVVCALPADQHPVVAAEALRAGKHVLVEKPMALSAQDARELVALAAERNRVLMTGHILCYHKAFERVFSLVDAGAIGKVRHIQSHRLAFGKFHARFDALWDLGPHDLSLVLALTGQAPSDVFGRGVRLAGGQIDAAHVHLGFADGVTAHVHISRHSPYNERRFVVSGTEGMIVWDDHADWPNKVALHTHRIWEEGGGRHFTLSDPAYQDVEAGMALTDELLHFMDCIAHGTTPQTSGQQGLDVITILEKAGHVC